MNREKKNSIEILLLLLLTTVLISCENLDNLNRRISSLERILKDTAVQERAARSRLEDLIARYDDAPTARFDSSCNACATDDTVSAINDLIATAQEREPVTRSEISEATQELRRQISEYRRKLNGLCRELRERIAQRRSSFEIVGVVPKECHS